MDNNFVNIGKHKYKSIFITTTSGAIKMTFLKGPSEKDTFEKPKEPCGIISYISHFV